MKFLKAFAIVAAVAVVVLGPAVTWLTLSSEIKSLLGLGPTQPPTFQMTKPVIQLERLGELVRVLPVTFVVRPTE